VALLIDKDQSKEMVKVALAASKIEYRYKPGNMPHFYDRIQIKKAQRR